MSAARKIPDAGSLKKNDEEEYNTEQDFQDEDFNTGEDLLSALEENDEKSSEEYIVLLNPADSLTTRPPMELPNEDHPANMLKSKKAFSSTVWILQEGIYHPENRHNLSSEEEEKQFSQPSKASPQPPFLPSATDSEASTSADEDFDDIANHAIKLLNQSLK